MARVTGSPSGPSSALRAGRLRLAGGLPRDPGHSRAHRGGYLAGAAGRRLRWPGQGGRRQPSWFPGPSSGPTTRRLEPTKTPASSRSRSESCSPRPARNEARRSELRLQRQQARQPARGFSGRWGLSSSRPRSIRTCIPASSLVGRACVIAATRLIKGMSVTRAGLAAGQASGVAGETYCRCITRLAGVMATMWQERAEDVPRPGTERRTRRS